MSDEPKKKLGRPRVYFHPNAKGGAPMLGFRFDPELYDYIHSQPQGPRQFLEELVRREMDSRKTDLASQE